MPPGRINNMTDIANFNDLDTGPTIIINIAECPPLTDDGAPDAKELSLMERLRESNLHRRQTVKRCVDGVILRWFTSGELDQELARLTMQHGRGRYHDQHGKAIDLRPHAFEDFIASKTACSESR